MNISQEIKQLNGQPSMDEKGSPVTFKEIIVRCLENYRPTSAADSMRLPSLYKIIDEGEEVDLNEKYKKLLISVLQESIAQKVNGQPTGILPYWVIVPILSELGVKEE